MPTMKPDELLARAALALRAQAPTQWDQFLQAVNEVRSQMDDQLAEAPLDRLQWAQGRARAMRDHLRDLMNAPATVQKIEESRKR